MFVCKSWFCCMKTESRFWLISNMKLNLTWTCTCTCKSEKGFWKPNMAFSQTQFPMILVDYRLLSVLHPKIQVSVWSLKSYVFIICKHLNIEHWTESKGKKWSRIECSRIGKKQVKRETLYFVLGFIRIWRSCVESWKLVLDPCPCARRPISIFLSFIWLSAFFPSFSYSTAHRSEVDRISDFRGTPFHIRTLQHMKNSNSHGNFFLQLKHNRKNSKHYNISAQDVKAKVTCKDF